MVDNQITHTLQKHSDAYRVEVIRPAVEIEIMISQILTCFFSNKDTKDIVEKHLFSDALTFEKKISLFNSIHKSKLFVNTEDSLRKDLNYLKVIRNFMAHSMNSYDHSYNSINEIKEVCFTSFSQRKGRVRIKVNIKEDIENIENYEYSIMALKQKRHNLIVNIGSIYDSLVLNC